jgi:uncharacterized protein involved in response to NO
MIASCAQRVVKATAMSKGFHHWWREGSGSLFITYIKLILVEALPILKRPAH